VVRPDSARRSAARAAELQQVPTKRLVSLMQRFLVDDRGLETVEYGVVTALIVIGTIAVLASLGNAVSVRLTASADTIAGFG